MEVGVAGVVRLSRPALDRLCEEAASSPRLRKKESPCETAPP